MAIDKTSLSILFIDDEKINLLVTKALLEKNISNLDCDILQDSTQTTQIIQESNYDLILMDIQMPVICGIEASKKIRKLNKDVPIIAYTSQECKDKKQEAFKVGINDYLVKPAEHKLLCDTVSKWLYKIGLQR